MPRKRREERFQVKLPLRELRATSKRYSRDLREDRRQLVHAAGCTHPTCREGLVERSPATGRSELDKAHALGVRIPRSLRRFVSKKSDGG